MWVWFRAKHILTADLHIRVHMIFFKVKPVLGTAHSNRQIVLDQVQILVAVF
jgi:hypothetical protein